MPGITVKNIPEDLYEKLRQNAARNRRSINNEIIFCLEQILESKKLDPQLQLEQIRKLREEFDLPDLTDDFLDAAKNDGRP